MVGFRGPVAERIVVKPNELWFPPDLFEEAFEIANAMGKVDTDLNNPNVHKGTYTLYEWNYMNDVKNWFQVDGGMRKKAVFWSDRVPIEFAHVEDFDTMAGKWRVYVYYGQAHRGWRWVNGQQVS